MQKTFLCINNSLLGLNQHGERVLYVKLFHRKLLDISLRLSFRQFRKWSSDSCKFELKTIQIRIALRNDYSARSLIFFLFFSFFEISYNMGHTNATNTQLYRTQIIFYRRTESDGTPANRPCSKIKSLELIL